MNYAINTLVFLIWSTLLVQAQEVKYRSDYDLNGPVKSCTVLTSYGKEIYQFTPDGKLEELVSYFDENNYQKIRYSYRDSLLVERRIELYEGGLLDKSSSVINLYQNNDEAVLIKEIIADYIGNTLENISYKYDSLQRVTSLKRLSNSGMSTSFFERKIDSSGVYRNAMYTDSIIKQRTDSIPSVKSNAEVRTIRYLDGFEDQLEVKTYNHKGELINYKNHIYLIDSGQWYLQEEHENEYNSKGQLIKRVTKEGNVSFTQTFVYQTDGSAFQNWVKQITMPNMTYTTRIIEYYKDN